MSFLFPLALAIAVLVGAPVAAHLLRRGRAQEIVFPAASLVPAARATARQRARLEDRGLLSLRAALVIALALLGASPLLRCSRLTVARPGGASMALAIVLDDSLSMQATTKSGALRWQRAREGALQLVSDAREGDAFALILAGSPARLALAATTELRAVRATLEALTPSDRATDLTGALRLAEANLADLPHLHKRVILLSDLATPEPLTQEQAAEILLPLDDLRDPFENCGIAGARVRSRAVEVELQCTEGAVIQGRTLELRVPRGSLPLSNTDPKEPAPRAEVLAKVPLSGDDLHGTVRLSPELLYRDMSVHLMGQDALVADDGAPVIPPGHGLVVGILADPATASVQTGGSTVLETALRALHTDARFDLLSSLPDEAPELERFGALVLDDPPGLTPEARSALQGWLDQGGVALVFWGPALRSAPLSSTFEPFLNGAPVWETKAPDDITRDSTAWLGEPSQSLQALGAKGRARLGSSAPVLGRWSDDEPWLIERRHGRGLALSVGLPVSVEESDLALRPGFLALLDHLVQQARTRRGGRETSVGRAWELTPGVQVEGPLGPLELQHQPGTDRTFLDPPVHGRYTIRQGESLEERFATLDPEEMIRQPRAAPEAATQDTERATYATVDISRELAFVVLALGFLELLYRGWLKRAQSARTDRRHFFSRAS